VRVVETIIQAIEALVKRELSDWPAEWVSFYWPGYTYEHTLRVRTLARAMARQMGADEGLVEVAALLHDIAKPDGEPHAQIGAQRAERILLELGLESQLCNRVCDAIRAHITPDPAGPVENLILSDADGIDAHYGYVSITRYTTIRAHRGLTVEEMIKGGEEVVVAVREAR
jgi:putative nucleotidyltransferase with HDIG domain